MRPIKFRGQAKDTKKWVYGSLIINEFGGHYIAGPVVESNEEYIALDWWQPVINESVGEFSGLLDKNGKEIFEGDILDVKHEPSHMTVCWSKGFAGFSLRRKDWAFQHFFGEAVEPEQVEVIGNIYEHPHLLTPQNPL